MGTQIQNIKNEYDNLLQLWIEAQNYKKAVEYLFEADRRGNKEAILTLSMLFAFGHGFEHTDKAAFQWYLYLAKKGDPEAQNNVGLLYVSGRGVQQSDENAIFWFMKAAAAGCDDAKENLRLLGIFTTE